VACYQTFTVQSVLRLQGSKVAIRQKLLFIPYSIDVAEAGQG